MVNVLIYHAAKKEKFDDNKEITRSRKSMDRQITWSRLKGQTLIYKT